MATPYNVINLSDLPVPDALVVPDGAKIFSQWLARLRELDPEFDALVESDPAYKEGEAAAYQLLIAYQRINDAVRAVLLASASGADLDQVAAGCEVERLMISPGDPDAIPPVEPTYESDEAFRERTQLSWSKLSVAGPRNAYIYFARSADADVVDVGVYGPEDHNLRGEVHVYVLSRTGQGEASAALCNTVYQTLSPDDVRPLTDYVTVKSAEIVPYSIKAELQIPEGPDRQTVYDNALSVLKNYTELSHRVDTMIPESAIYACLHQKGVARVKLASPAADILMQMGQAPWCESIDVTLSGVN